jgi:hypothetical protein
MTLPTFMMAIVKGTYSLRPLEALLRIEPALILPFPFGSSLIALGTNCRPAIDESGWCAEKWGDRQWAMGVKVLEKGDRP